MFYELVATLVAGVAAAGVVLALNQLTGKRLPKWMMPVGAGLGMILVSIANEYAWYDRNAGNLPEGLVVAQTIENSSSYRPWTKVKPYIDRFVAVDVQSIRIHPEAPERRMVDTLFMGRWAAVNKLTVLADCDAGRRAALFDTVGFGADGSVQGAEWVTVPGDDPLLTTICSAEVPR
ncbi:hypothetical protein [Aliiroseovarius subalbicans]|uniref:hypothetical protein n=1 Tax=Aliiroseovarius subalbicans TaxID=2925840 RepID=UPI001F562EF2|nr:hypothetical protein [Aliiroseovarius subalbicans]MCI2399266.1 hypothetical protein [Aliiroseovarius subalbicans]